MSLAAARVRWALRRRRPAAHRAGPGEWPLRLALVLAALGLAWGAATVGWREWQVATIERAMRGGADEGWDALARHADAEPGDLPLRAEAGLAAIALRRALASEDAGMRGYALARGRALVGHLGAVQPDWGVTQVLAAELAWAEAGEASPAALAHYAASYRQAPFLAREAQWRIAFGAEYWPRLDAATQAAMIAEAVWTVRRDGANRAPIASLLGNSPAGFAFQLALAQAEPRP